MVVRFCFIIMVLCNFTVYSQKYYSKAFDFGGNETAYGVAYHDTAQTIFLVNSFNPDFDSTLFTVALLVTLDSNGNTKIKTLFSRPMHDVFIDENSSALIQSSKKLIVMYDTMIDPVNYKSLCYHRLFRLNNNFDTLYSTPLETPDYNFFYKWIGNFVNGKLLFFNQSFKVEYGLAPLVMFCADTSGKMLWQKTYYGKRVRIQRTFVTSEKTILLLGFSFTEEASWNAEIDSLGNILWEKIISLDSEYPGGFPVSINNSRFWFGERSELKKVPYAFIYKTDNLGNLTWAKKIIYGDQISYYNHLSCGIGHPIVINNSFLSVGDYDQSIDSGRYYTWLIHFVKMDTLGNIKWRRFFKHWDVGNEAYRLDTFSDGFIISGTSIDTTKVTGSRDALLIKTDTNGCLIPGCHLKDGITEVIDNRSHVLLYPNPVSKILKLLIDDHRVGGMNQIEIYDANGNPVYSTQVTPLSYNAEIDVERFSEGLYYVAVYFDKDKRTIKKILLKK